MEEVEEVEEEELVAAVVETVEVPYATRRWCASSLVQASASSKAWETPWPEVEGSAVCCGALAEGVLKGPVRGEWMGSFRGAMWRVLFREEGAKAAEGESDVMPSTGELRGGILRLRGKRGKGRIRRAEEFDAVAPIAALGNTTAPGKRPSSIE